MRPINGLVSLKYHAIPMKIAASLLDLFWKLTAHSDRNNDEARREQHNHCSESPIIIMGGANLTFIDGLQNHNYVDYRNHHSVRGVSRVAYHGHRDNCLCPLVFFSKLESILINH